MTCARGNIPQALIAFIVDRYLCHNQFSQTRATFRNEASTLFVDSPANENLLSLEGIVDQYIFMKNQNILLNKQNAMLKQEKHNIQMLLQNLQSVLDSFHARSSPLCNTQAIIQNSAVLLPMQNNRNLTATPMQNSNSNIPVVSTSTDFLMQNTMLATPTIMDNINLSSPMIQMFHQKRKDTPTIDGCKVSKKPRGRPRKNQVQGINTLLPSPRNKLDSGSSSGTTQSLVENYALSRSQTDSVSGRLSNSNQCHTDLPLPSHISQPTEISPAASTVETIVPCYNVISTGMVQSVKQTVCKEDDHDHVISPEPYSDQTNKADANQTITGTLDKPFLNEMSDDDRDIWANLDFSNTGLDDWSEIDFSNIEGDNSSTKCSEI